MTVRAWKHRLPILIFPLLLLWRPLFAGEAFFWGTPLLQFVPWQRMAAEMWRSGRLPLWNPLVGCGAPLAANYQTAAFYPLNALYLLLPAEIALSWTTAFHLVLAGWGMYRWGRALGLDRFPALVGALALEGSGFLVSRVALFPSMALTFSWLPVWLWRAEMLVRRKRARDALWLGLALGLGLLAGHAQTAFYGGALLVAYFIFRVAGIRGKTATQKAGGWMRACALFGLALALGVGLAAVQLLPTAELMLSSQRSAGVDYDFAMTYSLWPWRLITFAIPDFFGNPGHGDYWGYPNYWEGTAYVGVAPLLLAGLAVMNRVVRRRARALIGFWTAVAAAALALALGRNTPVFPFLFRHVPTFDLFQAPARWLALVTVALAGLAALGAQWRPAGPQWRRTGALWVVVGLAFCLAGVGGPLLIPSMRNTFGPATARFGATLAAAGGILLVRREMWRQWAFIGLVGLDLLLWGWSVVPTVDRSLYRGVAAPAVLEARDDGAGRVYWPVDPTQPNSDYGAEYRVKFDYLTFEDFGPRDADHWREMREVVLPNTGMLDGVASVNNFDPLLVGRYVELLDALVETPSLLRVMGGAYVISDEAWPGGELAEILEGDVRLYRLLDRLGRAWVVPAARQVPPGEALAALSDPDFDPAAEALVEMVVDHRAPDDSAGGGDATLVLRDAPNSVTIHADLPSAGYLVLADTWYPGWRARVDGAPAEILRANHAFRAVWLEAGNHIVEMVYRPASVLVGGAISLATLLLFVGGIVWTRFRRKGAAA